MKLSQEEKELVYETVHGQGWPLLLKVVEGYCSEIESNIMRYNLGKDQDGANLIVLKAKAEGARSLQLRLSTLKSDIKKQSRN